MRRLVLLLCLVLPATANAATVTPKRFTGGPEANRLTVSVADGIRTYRDPAARLKAKAGCDQLDRRSVACPAKGAAPEIRLGDGDDRVKLKATTAKVYGEAGNDTLKGSARNDLLDGGEGDDVLTGLGGTDELVGGEGEDQLRGGAGDDTLIDAEDDDAAAEDLLDGGSGEHDRVVYDTRATPLTVDLAAGTSSTEDTLRGVEDLTAGSGDDTLTGGKVANSLAGGAGNDAITGGGGDDELSGADGDDTIDGGDGDDLVSGDEGTDTLTGGTGDDHVVSGGDADAEDAVDCGDGKDVVESEARDTLQPDCETASAVNTLLDLGTVPTIADGKATFTVSRCEARCRGKLNLTGPDGASFGTGNFNFGNGTTGATVEVTLTEAFRPDALLTVEIDPYATFDDPAGYRIQLTPPPAARRS